MPVVSVGFIGSGRLAERVARDLIKNVAPQRKFSYKKQRLVSTLLASDPSEERRRVFHRLGFTTSETNQDVLADCDLVFLGTNAREALAAHATNAQTLYVSLMGDLPAQQVEELLCPGAKVIRMMPKSYLEKAGLPKGVLPPRSWATVRGSHVSDQDLEKVMRIAGIDKCVEVDENLTSWSFPHEEDGQSLIHRFVSTMSDHAVAASQAVHNLDNIGFRQDADEVVADFKDTYKLGTELGSGKFSTHEAAIEEWSCPLCTLLNAAAEDRCAACDNVRPPAHQLRNSQAPESSTGIATASEVQFVYRPSAGVFFSSLPRNQINTDGVIAWRQEPRLVVNRRRGIRRKNVVVDAERKSEREQVETGTIEHNVDSTATQRTGEQEATITAQLQATTDIVEPAMTMEKEEERQEEEEEEDTAMDMEEPCFNLLGSGACVFAAPVVENVVENPCATDETKSRYESDEVDVDVEVSSPPRYPGFIPASKVHIEEPKIEEKLASAGLDLSDSEDEGYKPKLLSRQNDEKDESWEDKWVCQICTNLNDQTAMECSSCSFKRYRDPPRTSEPAGGSNLRWACQNCTNLNPPDATDCLMCLSSRKMDSGGANERWRCSLCATFNAPGTTRCELCDRSRDDEPKKAAAKGPQCLVCTNINAPGRTRCELCDSSLPTDEEIPDAHFVDLASSPLERQPSYTIEDDLDNPYADLSQYNAFDAPNEVADADPDYVDDISDNEPTMSLTSPRPLTVRSELKEFEHFVCMEDLRGDYGCRINYKKMFAGQRSRKSYADRLATRQAESRKRKRNAARNNAGGASTSTKRGGKASKSGKKRKATAAPRRASADRAKAPRSKRARKTGASARRTSSATTFSPGINHYDDSAADLGEDLNTMSWEGVGSAGYL
ncbi:hypothetical protein PC119_g1426 [Phytophthora cactorum]|nr:hypothetical protein PC119_g1426 [Phytophthora cactorum]